ncbi:E3 ubiquitin-protein ligase [Martiniozyma asiatica (nom. inval.)]|nr:E3 ubiquitin-protein ligase [Martiniozyma asiatica]
MEVPTCRICRCEAAEDAPLFHPCNCRGSIRYIHQDCLQSWLKHSKKNECDICHAKYVFQDIFEQDTPDRLPISLLFKQAIQLILNYQHIAVKYLLILLCAFELPIAVTTTDYIMDWQIGVPLPVEGLLKNVLGLGGQKEEILLALYKSCQKGVTLTIFYCLFVCAVAFLQSAIVSDGGMTKIIQKRIGPDPGININNLMRRRAAPARRAQAAQPQQELILERRRELLRFYQEHLNDADMDDEQRRQIEQLINIFPPEPAVEQPRAQLDINDILQDLNENADARDRNPMEEQAQNDMDNFWDGPKNVNFVLQCSALANFLVVAVMVILKLIPSLTGLIVIHVLKFSFSILGWILNAVGTEKIWRMITAKLGENFSTQFIFEAPEKYLLVKYVSEYFTRNLIHPINNAILNSVNWTPSSNSSERMIVAAIGYSFYALALKMVMKYMENSCSQTNPLNGGFRQIYLICLQLAMVAKVLSLMLIEWLFFPFFCGFQIQFALVPLFNKDIYTYQLELNSYISEFVGVLPIWFLGTFFMYFFASFVNIIRHDILRTGVMFFIRPSDDPNIRIVHDALMKPFMLKLSRMAMSAGIYSVYMLLEFTVVTWSLRLLLPVDILPFYLPGSFFVLFYLILVVYARKCSPIVSAYWKLVMNYGCRKMRLSSFFLGKDAPEERGRIIYKNIFARFSKPHPNYNEPVLESNVAEFFATHPNETCAFIPDGNYVRAPDNDDVSREFVKTCFYPVTKNDQLLEPLPELPDDKEIFNPYDDDDPLDSTSYTVVYRPPNFRNRIFGLFGIMWLASMFLTFAVYCLNISIKLFISSIFGNLFPTTWYQIDPVLLVTVTVLNHWSTIKDWLIQQKDIIFNNRSEKGFVNLILNDIDNFKTIITNLRNNATLVKFLSIAFTTYRTTTLFLLGTSFNSLTNDYIWKPQLTNQCTLALYFFCVGFFAMNANIYSRIYSFTSVFFTICRIGFIFYYSYTKQNRFEFIQTSYPKILYYYYSFMMPERSFETLFFYYSWLAVNIIIVLMILKENYKKFSDNVKRKYYSQGQVLQNVELDGGDDVM